MDNLFDVIVMGGGVVGLAAALAMAQRQYSVALIDAGTFDIDDSQPDLRVYAINQASQTLLQQLGAWQVLDKKRLSPYQHMHVWDGVTNAAIDFDSRMIASSELGTIIEESQLRKALLQKLADYPKVQRFPGQRITQLDSKNTPIKMASEHLCWQGRLLIAADGKGSPARDLLQCKLTTWSYHQQALVARVQTEKPHEKTAWQIFNADGPLAFLPLADVNQCSIVWSTSVRKAGDLMAMPEEEFNTQLTQAFASRLGEVKVLSTRHQFPLQMRHTQDYVGANWLLMGDAAHTIHPLAGLGLNVGLADLRTLLQLMDQQPNQLTSKRVLQAYQRQRKHAVWQTIAMMDSLKWLFANPLLPFARKCGLKICNSLPFIKRLFIEQAAK